MEMHIGSEGVEAQKTTKAITAKQAQYLEAYRALGSTAKAAIALGVRADTVRDALRRVATAYGKASIADLKNAEYPKGGSQSSTAKELMRLLKSQEYRCALSGEKLTPDTAELDHKMPRSLGGADTIENLQWLDKEINRMKGRMSVDQFIAACRKVVGWTS